MNLRNEDVGMFAGMFNRNVLLKIPTVEERREVRGKNFEKISYWKEKTRVW